MCRRWRWQDGSQLTLSELCNKATYRARQGVGSRGKMGPRLWPGQLPVLARASLVFTIIFIFCESGYHEVRSVSNSLARVSASQMMVLQGRTPLPVFIIVYIIINYYDYSIDQ